MNIFEGNFSGKGLKVGIIISRFNNFITERLLEGAEDALVRHDVKSSDIDVFRVSGAFEIPQTAKKVLELKKYDAVICLGAVIRGATPHFNYIAAEVTKGIASLSLQFDAAISYGILTTDSIEQAIERAGTKAGNKGAEAAMAVLESVNLYKNIR